MILFSDPKDFAPEGRKSVYPNTTRLPGMAVQSGSVLLGYGDPLTPLYPALGKAMVNGCGKYNTKTNKQFYCVTRGRL